MSNSSRKPSRSSRPGGSGSQRSSEKTIEAPPVELENQFILRLPEESEACIALREAVKSGASNLKERLFIQLEPDKSSNTQYLRKGRVQFDGWNFTSRLVDLPTILESHKTIDSRTLYKTADICQLLICKEGDEFEKEDASPNKKKKDPNKVDKKYLYPHGIGPPLKNCRKRRFRKTLKKKYVEAPEIEKEVKRLLRADNEAVSVKWEVITEEELSANKEGEAGKENPDVKPSQSGGFINDHKDLGLDLSDDDEDDDMAHHHANTTHDIDSEDNSRMSTGLGAVGDESSKMSDSMSMQGSLLNTSTTATGDRRSWSTAGGSHQQAQAAPPPLQFSKEMFYPPPGSSGAAGIGSSDPLSAEIMRLRDRKMELEHNINTCPNDSLRERFRHDLETVNQELANLENSNKLNL